MGSAAVVVADPTASEYRSATAVTSSFRVVMLTRLIMASPQLNAAWEHHR